MKLISPHRSTIDQPTPEQLGDVFEMLVALGSQTPPQSDRFLILEADDGSGAFIQAIAVDGHATWQVEVTNGDEAALRGVAHPVSRGRAVEYMTRFLNGERSLGNGSEWVDVDVSANRRTVTPTGLAIIILMLLVIATFFYLRQ